jgi:hypothetical protein
MKISIWKSLLLAACLLAGIPAKVSADNYAITAYVIAGGGGTSSNGQYTLNAAIAARLKRANDELLLQYFHFILRDRRHERGHQQSDPAVPTFPDHRLFGQYRDDFLAGHGLLHVAANFRSGRAPELGEQRLSHDLGQRRQHRHHHAAGGECILPSQQPWTLKRRFGLVVMEAVAT